MAALQVLIWEDAGKPGSSRTLLYLRVLRQWGRRHMPDAAPFPNVQLMLTGFQWLM